MFKVQKTILSEEIATAKFSCNITKCKGACCVVGDAGAPIGANEISALNKAFREVKDELRPRALEVVEKEGLIQGNNKKGYELTCTDGKECVFVTYTDNEVALCSIQKAYYEGRLNWEKPLSCHLFPMRLKRINDFDYGSFEYVPELCSSGCKKGKEEGTYLSEFLKKPLMRRYGKNWYEEFQNACKSIRAKQQEAVQQ